MKKSRSAIDKLRRSRSTLRRYKRLLFPSPAEMRFIELFGGKAYTLKWLRLHSTGFPAVIIYKRPKLFKNENVGREVRIGSKFVDFGVRTPYYKKAIEIDSKQWHMDVVKDFEKDMYLYERGWKVMRIPVFRLYNSSSHVQREVIDYLTK